MPVMNVETMTATIAVTTIAKVSAESLDGGGVSDHQRSQGAVCASRPLHSHLRRPQKWNPHFTPNSFVVFNGS